MTGYNQTAAPTSAFIRQTRIRQYNDLIEIELDNSNRRHLPASTPKRRSENSSHDRAKKMRSECTARMRDPHNNLSEISAQNSNANTETRLLENSRTEMNASEIRRAHNNRFSNEAAPVNTSSSSSMPSSTNPIPSTSNSNRSTEISNKKAREEKFTNQHSVDDKKDAILSNDKNQTRKKVSNNSAMQLKLLLLEIKKMTRDNYNVYYISDDNDAGKISDSVFCFEKANTRWLYQAKYFSQEYGSCKKINYHMLTSVQFNLNKLYEAFRSIRSCDRVIVRSNLELDKLILDKYKIRVVDKINNGTHSIKVNHGSEIFKNMVEKYSAIYKLAKYLNDHMHNGKRVKISRSIEKFHVMLVQERVFNVIQTTDLNFVGRFHRKFIESHDRELKPAVAHLRRHLKNLNHGELREGVLNVSKDFGKKNNFTSGQPDSAGELTDDDFIKMFFEKLEFTTCEKDVDRSIRQQIGEAFENIQSRYQVKELNKELFEKLRRGADQADLFPSLERKILVCELMNYQQKKGDAKMKLEFEPNTLRSLRVLLTESRSSTVVVKSDNPRLCASKLQQLVEKLLKYPEGRYFFLDVDELLSAKKHLLTVLSTALEHLLIVQTDRVDLKNEQVKDCLRDIRQKISNAPRVTNKMVIIQNINDPALDLSFDVTEHREIFNDKAGLTKDSEEKLSETSCQYYSHDDAKISLKEFILQPCDLTDLLSSAQCVNELVKGDLIIEKNLIKPSIFDSTYDLPRRLKRHVILNSAVLMKDSNDIFVISGIEKESIKRNVQYFKEVPVARFMFDKIANGKKKLNVHLLKHVSSISEKQLIWQRCSRSISTLMNHVVDNNKALLQSEPISDVLSHRIMILCGKPYTGKSYYLFELARYLQINNGNTEDWIVQMNLNNSMVEQYADGPLNSPEEAVDLLTKMLGYDELRRRLFRLSAAGRLRMKLSIFVDGLEELRENSVEKISEILRLLRETEIKRIYVATRPIFRKTLERALDDFAFSLDPLLEEEKKRFLMNTWRPLAGEHFADKLLLDLTDTIFNNSSNLMAIIHEPLFLHVFARVCWHYLKDGQDVPMMRRVYDIFKEYFDKFLNHLEISKMYRFCSYRILSSQSRRDLILREEQFCEEYRKLDHLSFAEYGAAKYLASRPLDDQIQDFNSMQDLATRASTVFFETFTCNCKVPYVEYIKRIGNNRLVIELFIRRIWKLANEHQKLDYLRAALIHSEDLFKSFLNRLNNTGPSQILGRDENTSSLVDLINSGKLVLEAAARENVNLTCELILRGADVGELSSDFVKRTAAHVASTLAQLKPHQPHSYWSIAEKLLKLAPEVCANLDEAAQLPRLLSYFLARGRLEVIKKIFKSMNDSKRQRLLHKRVDNRTPLEIVNSSASMTDEQRLKISYFLLDGRDYSEGNVFPVMMAAAKCGHVRCFEYFAGGSRKRLSEFFKMVLRSNQLEVLRFLLNNSKWIVDYNCAKNEPLHTAVIEGASIRMLKYLLKCGVNNQNSNGETALTLAIKAGVDLRIVKFLLEQGADPNKRDKRGLSPWCYAILAEWCRYSPEQQLDLMRYLKDKVSGLTSRHPDNYELTRWNKETDQKINYLWHPESFDLNSQEGKPRLHSALRQNNFVWFMFLLQHGADPNTLDSEHCSPLHIAVTRKNSKHLIETVRQLLRHGAIFDKVNKRDYTPLYYLREYRNSTNYKGEAYKLLHQAKSFFDCIELVKKESLVRDTKAVKSTALYWLIYCRDSDKRTLLHRAAEQSLPLDDFKNLLEFGELHGSKGQQRAWLDAGDRSGDTAAHVAARRGNRQMLEALALKGACLELRNSEGEAPLALAQDLLTFRELTLAQNLFAKVRDSCLETSLLLCTRRHCANIRDERGRGLLHATARDSRNWPAFQLLLRWKADPDARDNEGRAPLHCAVEADHLEATKLLLKAGASVDARDSRGRLPAELGGRESVRSAELVYAVNEMLERGWRDELDAAELDATVEALSGRYGLEPSVLVNARDSSRSSLAHYAARNCNLELLGALLRRGAVYNARNAANASPVDLADGEIKELLKAVDDFFENPTIDFWRAKRDAVDWEVMLRCRKVGGYTLLHAVLVAVKVEEARWLMDKGADVDVSNNLGASARKLAEGFQLV